MNKEHQDKNRKPNRATNGENAERRGSDVQDPQEKNASTLAGNQRDSQQNQQQDAGRQGQMGRQGEREFERQGEAVE